MNKAQEAWEKLRSCVGNVAFYLNPTEIKAITDKLADAPVVTAPKVAKKPIKKVAKK